MAQRNAQRNGLTNMDFLCEDTFELLPRLEREGHPYDFIILDPPAFTKRAALWRTPCAVTRRSTTVP